MLLPAKLRQTFTRFSERMGVEIWTTYPRVRSVPDYIAPAPAVRQNRRKTWEQRLAWNALPTGSQLTFHLRGAQKALRKLFVGTESRQISGFVEQNQSYAHGGKSLSEVQS